MPVHLPNLPARSVSPRVNSTSPRLEGRTQLPSPRPPLGEAPLRGSKNRGGRPPLPSTSPRKRAGYGASSGESDEGVSPRPRPRTVSHGTGHVAVLEQRPRRRETHASHLTVPGTVTQASRRPSTSTSPCRGGLHARAAPPRPPGTQSCPLEDFRSFKRPSSASKDTGALLLASPRHRPPEPQPYAGYSPSRDVVNTLHQMDEEIEHIFANMDNLAKPRGVQDVQELAACRKASKDLASTVAEELQASQASSAPREDTPPFSGDTPALAGDSPVDAPTSEVKQEQEEAKPDEKVEGEAVREQRMKELGVNKGDLAIMLDIRELKEEIRGLKNNFIHPRAHSQPDSEEEEGEGRGTRARR